MGLAFINPQRPGGPPWAPGLLFFTPRHNRFDVFYVTPMKFIIFYNFLDGEKIFFFGAAGGPQ